MSKKKSFTVSLDAELYRMAKWKADKLGFPLATLVRVFLKSFTTQSGVGFYVGDQDLVKLLNRWMSDRQFEKRGGGSMRFGGPRLKDIFELKEKKPISSQAPRSATCLVI